jgi:hypothetical protein
MKGEFWLGLVLAIPLAIIGNILTRPIENYLDSRIRSRALRRTRATRQEYERVKRYRERREEFYEFMLRSLLWTVSWTAMLVFGVGVALLVILTDTSRFAVSEGLRQALFVLCEVGIIVCLLMVMRSRNRALDMTYKVRNFSEYESRVKPGLESKEQE